jgi:hypothetical protein
VSSALLHRMLEDSECRRVLMYAKNQACLTACANELSSITDVSSPAYVPVVTVRNT